MTISDYAENKILDAVFTNASFAVAAVYVKLHTADPGEVGTTAAAGNTTRQAATFSAAASGATSNTNTITWTSVSTTEVYHSISLWDNVSAGNCLWTGQLTATKSVNSGDTFVIAIGDLDVTLD
jgi:hypothetical protein